MRPYEYNYKASQPITTFFRWMGIPFWGHLWIYFLVTLKAAPILLAPLLLAETIAIAENPGDDPWQSLYWMFGVFMLTVLANIPFHMVFTKEVSRALRRMEHSLRSALVRRLQHLSMTFHGNRESGRLQSKILRDVEEIYRMGELTLHHFSSTLIMLIWSVGYALYSDWKVGIAFLIVGPIGVAMMQVFRSAMSRRANEYRTQMETVSQRVSDMIDLVPVTRAHGVEQVEINQMTSRLDDLNQKGQKLDWVNNFFAASAFVALFTCIVGILFITAILVIQGVMSFEKIALYFGLFQMFIGNINGLIGQFPQINKAIEAVRSLGEVLECPDIEENEGKKKVYDVDGKIEFKDVSYAYDKNSKPAVQNFSYTATAGDCTAIVGESGSGKSTLMQLLVGFLRPQSGEIYFDGQAMSDIDMRTWRRSLAMVPQHTILFSGNLRDNITYGMPNYSDEQIEAAVEAANLTDYIKELPKGLDTPVGENGLKLSGGQRQRLAIARAIIRDPKVIVLDEATSALDVISEKLVQDAINNLIKGRTTFIVAHRLSTIRQANRVIVMKDGEAVEIGDQDDLMKQDSEFARLKALQS